MRNPYEPPNTQADYSTRHTRHPILLGVAVLFCVLTLLMGLAFCVGVWWWIASVEFAEVPTMIVVLSMVLGACFFILSVVCGFLATR